MVRPTCKVNGKGRIWPPMTSIFLKFFEFELDVHDYVLEIYISANFHFNPFSGASPEVGEILRFCDFFPGYTVFFLGHAPRSNQWVDFHGLWLIRRVLTHRWSFCGCDNIGIRLGVTSQKKLPKGGVNANYKHDQHVIFGNARTIKHKSWVVHYDVILSWE